MTPRAEPIEAARLPYRRGIGIVLLNRDGRVFLARRSDLPDAWQLPQGGIDEGETPRQAVLRELKEEIGTDRAVILAETAGWLRYDFPPALIGVVLHGRYRGQEQKWFALRFTGDDRDIDLTTHHPEFDAWRWAPAEEVLARIVPFKRPVYEAVFAEFAPFFRGSTPRPAGA